MKTINLTIEINTSPENVWKAIVSPEYYNSWTYVFTATSHFKGGWNKGDTIRFLAYSKDGKLDGMVSEIAESIFPSFLSIRHLGYVYDGKDDTESDEIKSWAPAYENYSLTKSGDKSTLFELFMDVTDDYYDMFMDLWPKALKALKSTAENIKDQFIFPCLWFDHQAHEAADFYCSIFAKSRKLGSNAFMNTYEIWGCKFMAINGGPKYNVNQAVSYYVYCGSNEEIDRLYTMLSDGGKIIMPLDKYMWSPKYAWVVDKYGVSWQLDIDTINNVQKIVPTLLFANEKKDKVKEAVDYYIQIFNGSRILMEAPYNSESGMPAGSVLFAQFMLSGVIFNAMSSVIPHDFDFTHGNSFVAECENQDQIDHLWEKLGEGGVYERCGWLSDKFGVSWQVIPEILHKLVADPEKGQRVIQAFIPMTKFEIEKLINA